MKTLEIAVEGEVRKVPSATIEGRTVIRSGKYLKMAVIHDENWIDGEPVADPPAFIRQLKGERTGADVFTFGQRIPDVQPKYNYPMEWDNVAAIPITTFDEWFEKRVEYDVRKAVRKIAKLGLVVKAMPFTDDFVRGIQGIYNETPMRQGKPFWHFGKDFESVKRENSTYLDRSEFIGAYFQDELIGFIRMVYVGNIASTLQVIGKTSHFNKKPVNAVIAKAVEICCEKKLSYFVYDKFTYGNRTDSPLTEFKRRNGFEEIKFPRYYVPLTLKGQLAIKCKMHRGLSGMLPPRVLNLLLKARSMIAAKATGGRSFSTVAKPEGASETPQRTPAS